MVGAFERVVTDSFGATVESLALPWGAFFLSMALRRWPRRASQSGEVERWVAVAVATAAVLLGAFATDSLAGLVGWIEAPRVALPVTWTLLAAVALRAPARATTRLHPEHGVLFALAAVVGLVAPPPAVALLVGIAALGGSEPAEASPAQSGIPDRLLGALSVAGFVALGVHMVVVLRPSLDPSPAVVISGALAASVGVPVARTYLRGTPWSAWLGLALVALGVAAVLPSGVGATRAVHTSLTPLFDLSHTPSIGPAIAGAALGMGFGVAGGWAGGGAAEHRPERLAAGALGLVVGIQPVPPSGLFAVGMAGVVTIVALLLASSRWIQGASLVPGALVLVLIWRGTALPVDILVQSPLPGLRSPEAWTAHIGRPVNLVSGQTELGGLAVGSVLATPEDWRSTSSTPVTLPFETDVSGRVGHPSGRAAEAEVMAGLLAAVLAPRLDRVLLLGDDVGNAVAGLEGVSLGAVDIATPVPNVVQDIARLAPSRRDRWLSPGTRLWPEHPESVLRRAPTPAAIVDIAHATWADASHPTPTPAHLRAARSLLGDYGVYVLCLHLDDLASSQPASVAKAVASTFETVQIWLPPTGADSVLIVASSHPLPLSRLESRAPEVLGTMRNLGFPNTVALASMAIGDRATVDAWQSASPRILSRWWLDRAVRGPIALHLADLAPHIASVEHTWNLEGAETGTAALASRLDTRRRFLELLGDAARGDVAGALDKARGLSDDDGGRRALRALVGPHLDNAKKALAIAIQEGPGSAAWADVDRFATTARMIAPTSAEPLLLLGRVSLARGDLNGAQSHFFEAEKLADGDLEALTGLATVARLRRDRASAERYYREAATANPREWVAWHRLGMFLLESGRLEEAESELEKAVDRAKGQSPAPNIGLAQLHLEQGSPSAALVHLERAIVLDPTAEGYFLRGVAHVELDQLDKAEDDFRMAVLADPTMARAHGEIGRIRAIRGDKAAAEEAWRAVLRIDPSNASARENLRRLGIEDRGAESGPPG